MNNFSDFFWMGGYGFYVWSAYISAFLILMTNVVCAFRKRFKLMRELENKYNESFPSEKLR